KPIAIDIQIGIVITEHQTQEDFSDDAASNRAELWSADLLFFRIWNSDIFQNRNFDTNLVFKGFSQYVSPQRALTLKRLQLGNFRREICHRAPYVRVGSVFWFVDCFSNFDFVVRKWLDSQGSGHILTTRQTKLKCTNEVALRQ